MYLPVVGFLLEPPIFITHPQPPIPFPHHGHDRDEDHQYSHGVAGVKKTIFGLIF